MMTNSSAIKASFAALLVMTAAQCTPTISPGTELCAEVYTSQPPSIENMLDNELMQENELAPRGLDAAALNALSPNRREALEQLYCEYYAPLPLVAKVVQLKAYRALPAAQRAGIERVYTRVYAADYPATPQKMLKRFLYNPDGLSWYVAYNKAKAAGLLKGIAAAPKDLFNEYMGKYEPAVYYEIYRAAIQNPTAATLATRKAICSMLNWGHNGRNFDGAGYCKVLYFAKPDDIEKLGIRKKQVVYDDTTWVIYTLAD